MPTGSEHITLAGDFPPASAAQWRALVSGVLHRSGLDADADPIAALTTTVDGIDLLPLYTCADVPDPGRPGELPYVRGATADGATVGGWDVRARHADPDTVRTRAAVLADLERGASSLWLVLGDGGIAVDDLAVVLDGVLLDLAPVALDAGVGTEAAAAAFLELVAARGTDPADVAGTLGADPIGLRARTGAELDLGLLARLAGQLDRFPGLRVATVDASVFHDAGASHAEELAQAAAVGVAYLRALVDAGSSVEDALGRIEFRYAVTADQFGSIAKLRAARRIWGRVAELSGAADARRGQWQHAVTSAAMMTRRDPWVNMLRTTIGCFAAAVGGADAITVAPFDAAVGLPDDLARRIARNTHAILHDESSLGRVVDAAGGSWFVETLTHQLAEAAWDLFTEIERGGGAAADLDGAGPARLAARRSARADAVAHRVAPITGVSEYAFPDEEPVVRQPAPQPPAGGPLLAVRYAQDFEALRDRTDAMPERPAVFLATLGPPSAHSARLSFASNLFQAAGLRLIVGEPADFAAAGTSVACLCGSGRSYGEDGAAALEALASARQVWLAGAEELDGVDGNVFTGCDALAVLRTTLDVLGVPA